MFARKLLFSILVTLSFQDSFSMCHRRNSGRDTNPGENDDRNPIIVNVEAVTRAPNQYVRGWCNHKNERVLEGFAAGVVTTAIFFMWYRLFNPKIEE